MEYIDGSPTICGSVYRIYAYDSRKDGWWCLNFLGDHKTRIEAEEAITKYLQQPENQSNNVEVYQVRLNVTSSILCTNVVWNPDGTLIERRTP